VVVCYGGRGADLWWNQNREKLNRLGNLEVLSVPPAASQALAALARRNMQLQCTIQDRQVWLTDGEVTVAIEPAILHGAN
jgi:uncharacterized protein YaeQ